jgi:hypothetical protein
LRNVNKRAIFGAPINERKEVIQCLIV